MAGQVFVFFILTVAAAESAIGLAILVVLFRNRATINVDELDSLEGLTAHPEPCSTTLSRTLLLAVPLAPLVGAIVAGLFGKADRPRAARTRVTILGVLRRPSSSRR